MATNDREQMVKPDFMSEEDWEGLKNATASLERIRGDAKADVARYLANPEGWSTGKGSPSGLPTLLLTMVGRKSGKEHTTPWCSCRTVTTWWSSPRWQVTTLPPPGISM